MTVGGTPLTVMSRRDARRGTNGLHGKRVYGKVMQRKNLILLRRQEDTLNDIQHIVGAIPESDAGRI